MKVAFALRSRIMVLDIHLVEVGKSLPSISMQYYPLNKIQVTVPGLAYICLGGFVVAVGTEFRIKE